MSRLAAALIWPPNRSRPAGSAFSGRQLKCSCSCSWSRDDSSSGSSSGGKSLPSITTGGGGGELCFATPFPHFRRPGGTSGGRNIGDGHLQLHHQIDPRSVLVNVQQLDYVFVFQSVRGFPSRLSLLLGVVNLSPARSGDSGGEIVNILAPAVAEVALN